MPRGSFQWHEPKKAKKAKQKIVAPTEVLTRPAEPERIPPKRRPRRDGEEGDRDSDK